MQAVLYTGTGATQTINCGFQPDLVWIKSRSAATDHKLTDSVRGATKALISNSTGAETTDSTGITAFTSTGFTLGSNSVYNNSGATYVAWCWNAGSGSSSSNTAGSITSTVSVNASAGFSVVTYTGTGAAATVGHGLGVAPSLIFVKNRIDAATSWITYHKSLSNTQALFLNTNDSVQTSALYWNSTTPTSNVFSVAAYTPTNGSTNPIVAYCWTEINGYSKFGSYTGNGSTDGSFVYLGLLAKFLLIKRTDATAFWVLWDTTRNTYNVLGEKLFPNSSNPASSAVDLDITSNGFKIRSTDTNFNASGGNYIYAAFAENPFKFSLAR
jgi:hypothetical protein